MNLLKAASSSVVVALAVTQSLFGGTLTVSIDNQTYDVPLTRNADGTWSADNTYIGNGEGSVTLNADLDPDPSIAYGIAVVDFGAPSVFGFVFGTPIVPTGAPNFVTASIVGGLTDFTGDGVAITPVLPDSDGDTVPELQVAEVGFPTTNMGVDVGPGASFPAATAGALYPYGPFSSGVLLGPGPGPWTFLSVSTSFMLSGGGDVAALTGFASIELVPEPHALCLLLSAGFPLLLCHRPKRQ
jgi:hypothetical protein